MKNKIFKVLSLAICVFVALTFVGCNGSKETTDINLDIDLSQKPDISVLFPNSGYTDEQVNSDANALLIQQLTGYKIKYSQLPAADSATALNLQIINREKFNAIKVTIDQFQDLVAQDALTDLSPAIDKFGSVMKSVISKESWDVATVDGKIYGIPERASSDNIEKTIVFRQDLLDENNLRMPTTKDDLLNVLRTLKQKEGIDKHNNSYYPLTFDKYSPLIYSISSAFNIYTDWQVEQGAVKHYLQSGGMKDYIDFMAQLYSEKLIDPEIVTNDAANAISKFSKGNASAIATNLWSVPSIVMGLQSNGIITEVQAKGELDTVIGYLRSLKNSDGEYKVFRNSGIDYVTVVPFYMAENAGYVVDWANKKLTDTDESHNFRSIVIGEEGVNFTKTGETYLPISSNFGVKDTASYFLTGSNEKVYTNYWLARVRKNNEMFRAWSILMDDANTIGVYDVMAFAPPIAKYSANRSNLGLKAMNDVYNMICHDKSSANYAAKLSSWETSGGTDTIKAINNWYLNK